MLYADVEVLLWVHIYQYYLTIHEIAETKAKFWEYNLVVFIAPCGNGRKMKELL